MKLTLRQLRMMNELTQEETAEALGVSTSTWKNWEYHKSFPDAPKIKRIEKFFNTTYDDIIFLDSNHGLTVNDE